jgi:hypothetical protein
VTLLVGQAGTVKRQRASAAAGFAAVAIAGAAFIGWWAGLPVLASWGAGFPAMKPMTAACLGALGLALIHPGRNSRFAIAVGLAAAVLAGLDLLGIDFGINRWLVPPAAVRGTNAMAGALGLAGASLALSRLEGYHFAATALGSLAGIGAVYALVNIDLTGLDPLSGSIEPPALPTIMGQLCIAAGIILLSANVDREIIGEIERLQALAASLSLRQADFAEFQRQAEAWLGFPQSGNIVLIDPSMRQLVNTRAPFGHSLPNTVVPLTAASAQAVGLALHELATNAGKYGALSTDTGHVNISWRADGDTFTMRWTERNGPPVSAPKRRGFGTIVMEAMIARSVGGMVGLDYAPPGVTWRLTCPAANVLEHANVSKLLNHQEQSKW